MAGAPHRSTHGVEPCTKWTYDVQRERWTSEPTQVRFLPDRLGEGGMRVCYRMDEVFPDGTTSLYVAKFYKAEMRAREEDVFSEAAVQYVADTFAQDFNRKPTPKKVAFLACHVLRLTARPGQPLCFAEPFLQGRFAKHNNNNGGNFSYDPTPAAFSHFTYESSNHLLLVCDIQGVGDVYTDPQIHSFDGQGFGFGNLGRRGIDRFLASHRCNDVCRAAGLQPTAAETQAPAAGRGSVEPFGMGMMPMMMGLGGPGGGGGGGHPLAGILHVLQQMPMGQAAYAGPIQGIHTVLGQRPGAVVGALDGRPVPRLLPARRRPGTQDAESGDVARAVAASLRDAEDAQVSQALQASCADDAELARALRESLRNIGSPASRSPQSAPPVVRGIRRPVEVAQRRR